MVSRSKAMLRSIIHTSIIPRNLRSNSLLLSKSSPHSIISNNPPLNKLICNPHYNTNLTRSNLTRSNLTRNINRICNNLTCNISLICSIPMSSSILTCNHLRYSTSLTDNILTYINSLTSNSNNNPGLHNNFINTNHHSLLCTSYLLSSLMCNNLRRSSLLFSNIHSSNP
jgi:hypothetical protein